MRLSILAFALAASTTTLAAQTVTEYYVVQDSGTKRCTIVSERPTATTTVVVGDRVYKTRTEAEDSIKTTKVCVRD
jgi:hypothetical protein